MTGPEARAPKRGEHVALRSVEDMWIVEIGDDGMLKVRDEEGFTVLVKADTLGWDEGRGMWAYIKDIEAAPDNPEGDPTRNGAFGA